MFMRSLFSRTRNEEVSGAERTVAGAADAVRPGPGSEVLQFKVKREISSLR
jgi:hypothetical protein